MSENTVKTIAGKEVGQPENMIVLWNQETGEKRNVKIRGRWYYVQKCRRESEINGIVIPEKTQDNTVFAFVMAKGDRCDKPAEPTDKEQEMGMSFGCDLGLSVGDKIMLPDDHAWGIQPSPYGDGTVERFIHEDIIIGVAGEDD